MKLYIVGFGCGSRGGLTIEAEKALESCDLIVGYTVYADIVRKWFPEKKFYTTQMTQERDRVRYALEQADKGIITALICSGDSTVYGMTGLALETSADFPNVEIIAVAGVTAALSGNAVLGAPLTHDFAVISLSDLLTPIEKIWLRLECAAKGDFAIAIYNPSSKKRIDYLKKACEILLKYKSPETVCGYVKNIGRSGQESKTLTLFELMNTEVDMFTTVFIGNSQTKLIKGKMITPRGYTNI